jgi:hypothetical protein
MKSQKILLIIATALVAIVGSIMLVLVLDHHRSIEHWRSVEGFTSITTIELPETIDILDHQVSAQYSIADRPSHKWLLTSSNGFESITHQVSEFMLGGAIENKVFSDVWGDIGLSFKDIEIGDITMGIGSGRETIFVSADNKYAILHAFRD